MPFSFGGRVTLLGIFNAGQLKEASEIKTRFKIYKLSLKLQIKYSLDYIIIVVTSLQVVYKKMQQL